MEMRGSVPGIARRTEIRCGKRGKGSGGGGSWEGEFGETENKVRSSGVQE
jgi:hypothetical protein